MTRRSSCSPGATWAIARAIVLGSREAPAWPHGCRPQYLDLRGGEHLGKKRISLATLQPVEQALDRLGNHGRIHRFREVAKRAEIERALAFGRSGQRADEDDGDAIG